jgi:hypothetical protein
MGQYFILGEKMLGPACIIIDLRPELIWINASHSKSSENRDEVPEDKCHEWQDSSRSRRTNDTVEVRLQ